ncbi:uncharacterized protein LOC144744809 [Ciona intestinalis]
MDVSAHTLSLQQTLKGVEAKLLFLGNGPHNAQQANEHQTLTALKQRLMEQIQVSIQTTGQQQQQTSQNTAVLTNPSPQSSSPLITQPTLPNQNVVKPAISQLPQVVLSKPRPPAPQFITQVPQEKDNKILNRQRLQELIREIDPAEQLDEDVEEMLMQITDDFIENVVSASCELAKHRNSNTLEVKDLKLHLDKQWNISIPGYGSEDIKPFKKPTTADAHKQRLALIRKAIKK